MKKLKMIGWTFFIAISVSIISISVYKSYVALNEKSKVAEALRFSLDYTMNEDKHFSNSPDYIGAVSEYKNEKYESAVLKLDEEIKKNPDHAQAYYLRGKIYEEQTIKNERFYLKMAENYDQYIEKAPNGKRISDAKLKAAQYYIYIGLSQNDTPALRKAEKYLLALDQTDSAVRMSLGAIYLDKQHYSEAVSAFEKSTSLSISEIKLKYNSLGLAYMKQEDYQKAENAFQIAIKLNPENKYAYNNLGVTYVQQQKYKEAREQFLLALKLDPKYHKAYVNKVWTENEMKRKRAAR